MIVRAVDGLRYYQFESFNLPGVVHGIFARHGGVSPAPFASLNMAVSTGDSRENVTANRQRAFRALGRDPDSIADLWQVHSADVVVADAPRGRREHLGKADVLVTDRADVTLFLRFADCVPILLYDPRRQVAGLVHAGWKGTLLKAPAKAVRAMVERFGCRPEDILVGIGPSIGPCHYEVGPEVAALTEQAFPGAADLLGVPEPGLTGDPAESFRPHLDLWAANALALKEAGVTCIEIGRICTACNRDEFYSHRGDGAKTGRFGAVLGLRGQAAR
jgi:YfiH family protein